ncbi:RDD family protein [Saccharothrix carnea]|uniref:RDD family protein n=1 Tax=Saccharothrix carnea TaxID=1280637 RepID=A0A2P8IBX0_SACCR|nr:RDD family protein [Saccharothrix carnea]PSL55962.1 RDD family protein [Saccharothrix carnea]
MAAPGITRPPTRLELVRAEMAPVLGPRAAARIEPFDDGTLYVRAGALRQTFAWLVDFVVFLLVVGLGYAIVSVPYSSGAVSDNQLAVAFLVTPLAAPLLYGLCYGNGRALGAVLTGTRLVRLSDGGRIGWKAPWAMMVRTVLLPLLIGTFVVGAVAGGSPPGSPVRVSIDRRDTDRLRAAGHR